MGLLTDVYCISLTKIDFRLDCVVVYVLNDDFSLSLYVIPRCYLQSVYVLIREGIAETPARPRRGR